MSESMLIPAGHQRTHGETDLWPEVPQEFTPFIKAFIDENSLPRFKDSIKGRLRCAAKLSEATRQYYFSNR